MRTNNVIPFHATQAATAVLYLYGAVKLTLVNQDGHDPFYQSEPITHAQFDEWIAPLADAPVNSVQPTIDGIDWNWSDINQRWTCRVTPKRSDVLINNDRIGFERSA